MLAACAGTPAAPATPTPITVELKSFSLTPSTTTAKAGDVTFIATNMAEKDQHEFIVIKSELAADKLLVGADDRIDEESVEALDEVPELEPGKSGTLTVNLDAGHYVLICNIEGHYRQGMHTDFTVNP
jgi:uncharacterized cupredoxin-like copper-binding protein